jgi:hypothetical protein
MLTVDWTPRDPRLLIHMGNEEIVRSNTHRHLNVLVLVPEGETAESYEARNGTQVSQFRELVTRAHGIADMGDTGRLDTLIPEILASGKSLRLWGVEGAVEFLRDVGYRRLDLSRVYTPYDFFRQQPMRVAG